MANKIVDKDEWTRARVELLELEKQHLKAVYALNEARQSLPWRRVSSDYVFREAGSGAEIKLVHLFGDDHEQLVVQHMMFGEEWTQPCAMCSSWVHQFAAVRRYLEQRTRYVVAASASPAQLQTLRQTRGWTDLPMVQAPPEFSMEFGVRFTPEQVESKEKLYNYGKSPAFASELFGISVFARRGDEVFHTYSTYGPGLSELSAPLKLFDLLPSGRAEKSNLDWTKLE